MLIGQVHCINNEQYCFIAVIAYYLVDVNENAFGALLVYRYYCFLCNVYVFLFMTPKKINLVMALKKATIVLCYILFHWVLL